jgi:hypothetical protein
MSFIVIYIPTGQSKNGAWKLGKFSLNHPKTNNITVYQPVFSGYISISNIIGM